MADVKTPISVLNEITAQQRMAKPLYSDGISEIPSYTFKCTVQVGSIIAHGYALTKKEAKHKCAQEALNMLGFGCERKFFNNNITVNYVGLLNEHATKKQVPYPQYIECPRINEFIFHCHFMHLKTEGTAVNKKMAKQDAAKKMFHRVNTEAINYPTNDNSSLKNLIDDDLMKKILTKYNSLQISNEPPNVETQIELPSVVEKRVATMEDIIKELEKRGHSCNIEVFQRDPYIVALKIDEGTLGVMAHGETKKFAMDNLYERTSSMLNNGFTFKSVFKEESNIF